MIFFSRFSLGGVPFLPGGVPLLPNSYKKENIAMRKTKADCNIIELCIVRGYYYASFRTQKESIILETLYHVLS